MLRRCNISKRLKSITKTLSAMRRFWKKSNRSTDKRSTVTALLSTVVCGLWTILLLSLIGCTQTKSRQLSKKYTCPMHPEIVKINRARAQFAFMDLVQKNREGAEIEMTSELNYLLKPTNALVMSSIKTITPVRDTVMVSTRFNGVITYDTRNAVTISSRIAGRVEKLFVPI